MRTAYVYNFLIEANIMASAAIVLMLALRKWLRKPLGSRALCFGWLMVAVRLLCPLALPNPLIGSIRPGSVGDGATIIATGGGIVTREKNIALMRQSGLVVWLNRPLGDMIADVRQDTRPNLDGDKEERMRTLFAQREALYRRAAHLEFDNTLPPMQSAEALTHMLSGRET